MPLRRRMPALTARMWRTASTTFPVPASPLVRIIAAPAAPPRNPAERLAEVAAAADEGHLEGVLVDVVLLVGRRQHLGLVDVIDAERLEDLGLDEVADPGLRHHRDGHRGLDLLDQAGIAHPRYAAVPPDVGGHALERHHRARPGLLGDPGVVGGDD